MSHGPSGLAGVALDPAWTGSAVSKWAPITVIAAATISTKCVFALMHVPLCLPNSFRHLEETVLPL